MFGQQAHLTVPCAAAAATEDTERRWARRKTVRSGAAIVSPELSVAIPCILHDVSSTGAKLEIKPTTDNLLGGRAKLPVYFTLAMRVDRMEVDCAIAWRSSGILGVRFVSTPRPLSRGPRA